MVRIELLIGQVQQQILGCYIANNRIAMKYWSAISRIIVRYMSCDKVDMDLDITC